MKKVKITANELDEAENWLKDVDTNETSLPMLLASYGHDIRLSKFPVLNNLSDEISNLAEKIKGIQFYDFVSIRLSEYNILRDFKTNVLSRFHEILGSDQKQYNRLTVDDLCDVINKEISKKQNKKNNEKIYAISVVDIALWILFFIEGLVLGFMFK